jgi:hypothetical protein
MQIELILIDFLNITPPQDGIDPLPLFLPLWNRGFYLLTCNIPKKNILI